MITRQTRSDSIPQFDAGRRPDPEPPSGGALTRHLRCVDESYFQHCAHALRFAVTLLLAAFCCLIHALLPFLFEKTGSRLVERLHRDMVLQCQRQSARRQGSQPEPADPRSPVCS